MRRPSFLLVAVLIGCGGGTDSDAGVDADTDTCGPSPCGACMAGFEAVDRCVAGEWICECRDVRDAGPADDGGPEQDAGVDAGATDAGADDAGAVDAGAPDGGASDAGTPDAGPNTCMSDSDCAIDEWCRPTMAGGMECVPFQLDGDPCGGFVLPWAANRCGPGLSCVSRNPLLADAPGICAVPLTVAELTSMSMRYDMRTIGVLDGWVLGGAAACTRIACPPSMPCCNSCSSGEFLGDTMSSPSGVNLADMGGTAYMCTGDECMPYTTCTQAVDLRYRVIGQYVSATNTLRVQSIVPLP